MQRISRRRFLSTASALYFCGDQFAASIRNAFGALPSVSINSMPFFDLPAAELVNIRADNLSIGTSLYPWRKPHNPEWLFSESKAIGFNCVRFAYERNHCQRIFGQQDKYQLPKPDVSGLIHASGLDVIMLIQGHAGNESGEGIEFIRLEDGSIDGRANASAFAAYTHWLVQHTRDFVQVYELWNEAFGHIDDAKFKKSFGPGGSKENADNYAAMMFPSMQIIRKNATQAKVTIEGNYWNVEKSVAQSKLFQTLLSQADYVVKHPYGYDPLMYSKNAEGHAGQFYEQDQFYRSVNPDIKWIYTEYAPTAKILGAAEKEVNGELQAKAVLRTTLLHLRHGINKLCLFDLYYPKALVHTLVNEDGTRRLAWYTMQQFLKSCALPQRSVDQKLIRANRIDAGLRDLSIATQNGFLYCIWQETEPHQLRNGVKQITANVELRTSSKQPLRLDSAVDPLTGKDLHGACEQKHINGNLNISIPCRDYPLLCKFVLA